MGSTRLLPFLSLAGVLCVGTVALSQPPIPKKVGDNGKKSSPTFSAPAPVSILGPGENPIDLGSALRLAGVDNPELLLARQRVVETTALRQLAAVQILPNINVGTNYDLHRGVLQQAAGNILHVNRDSLYVGLGANAVGAGTVNIPGVSLNINIGEVWFNYLASRQRAAAAQAGAAAVNNDVLLRVSSAYLDLLRSEGRQAVAKKNRDDGLTVARLTFDFAQAGQGRKADADRADVELKRRDVEYTQAEGETLASSARLAQLLNLDPGTRLRPVDGWVVPAAIVPDPIALPDLVAIALMQRPELASRRSEVRQSLYELSLAKLLPFSPNVIVGFSAGGFGGGSDLISSPPGFVAGDGTRFIGPRFGDLFTRTDFDVLLFWTIRNLGAGNVALARAADSRAKQTMLRELETLNLVRAQVAEAHAWTAARLAQIDASEKAVRASQDAFTQDFVRIKGGQGLPLELVDSMRLLVRSRYAYLDSIIEYNRAQFQLWVAVGQPPADALVRPVPMEFQPPPAAEQLPHPRPIPDKSAPKTP